MSASASHIVITLPDGKTLTVARGTTGAELAAQIGPGLAKAALALEVNGKDWDIFRPIEEDASVKIITRKDDKALELIRHDCSHIMAMAVQELFPGTQVTIGPSIEDGFYYDFARNEPFKPEDLEKIEAKMHEIVKRDLPTRREVWPRAKAIAHFKDLGEQFKAELIESIPSDEDVTLYWHGEWHDLCRGPHLASTGKIGDAFKLTKLAGSYWRGDAKNAQLQRIYGTAWRDKKELKEYLVRMEEAAKRDHRKIGREMDLFHLQEEAAGQVFWHKNGTVLWNQLEGYVRRKKLNAGYQEVKTPQLIDRKLWEASGHWGHYRENMFIAEIDDGNEHKTLAVKPMNCPGQIQIFKSSMKSYRDLPLRMCEFGACHRYEPSGALHGIMRLRGFTQDDAHVFCTEEQITEETVAYTKLLFEMYKELGFEGNVSVKLSTRPDDRIGSDEVWDNAENALATAMKSCGVPYTINPGEGAFYGPKLEFVLRDCIGRDWQCGTQQVDFNMPGRLEATYIAEDGSRKTPVMLHNAVLGSMERFLGIMIENYMGKFPLWLTPVQAVVATIVSDADDYAYEVKKTLTKAGLRVDVDASNEKINYKVREHSLAKVPYLLVVGRREAENHTVAVRQLGSKDQKVIGLKEIMDTLVKEGTPPDLR